MNSQRLKDLGMIITNIFAPQLTCSSFATFSETHKPLSHIGLLLLRLKIIFLNREEETNEKSRAQFSLGSLVIYHNASPTVSSFLLISCLRPEPTSAHIGH